MLNCPRKFVQIIFLEKNNETEKTAPKENQKTRKKEKF